MKGGVPIFFAVLVTSCFFPSSHGEKASEHDVIPILLRRCSLCHAAGEEREGGLDLRSRESILAGGDSGPAVVPGDADASLLVRHIANGEMPPEESHGQAGIEAVTAAELETIRDWIDRGLPVTPPKPVQVESFGESDRNHWAFRPPRRPPSGNRIDDFIGKRLRAEGLPFSPEAEPLVLLRRASYLLTGLPPSPEEIAEFAARAEKDPNGAFEEVVDRLLASPRYGERWGRIWLDVAGYADSEGKRHADMIRKNAWRYRDYVIRSFNGDKPYDRFLVEQLAGDELVDYQNIERLTPEVYDCLVATGFLRMAPDGTTANPVNRVEDRLEVISDEMRVLSEGVLGLTMECARCHDHKYDPLTQRDYYSLVAVFKGAYDEFDWLIPQAFRNQSRRTGHRLLDLGLPEEELAWHAEVAAIDAKIEEVESMRSFPGDATRKKALDNEVKKLEARKPDRPRIRALWDRGNPTPAYVLNRGNPLEPVSLTGPGVPGIFGHLPETYRVEKPAGPGTGRRLAFARWLTQPDHPLTARVLVNRVWREHFGRGIVESLDNFGKLGAEPSHPELLDFLALEFIENGWSIKKLHRRILLSRTWRQRSLVTEELGEKDPKNGFFSRAPLRRLTAEEVRDTVVLLSGRLDETPFGAPDQVEVRDDGMVTSAGFDREDSRLRRSIYLRHRRKEMLTFLEAFDQPAMNPNCVERIDSSVVTQPLHLLNNAMVHRLARDFAGRVRESASGDRSGQVETAWLSALHRFPTRGQMDSAERLLANLEAQWKVEGRDAENARRSAFAGFCHMLVNSAEFLYVD